MVYGDKKDRNHIEEHGGTLQVVPTRALNTLRGKFNSFSKESNTSPDKFEEFKDRPVEHQDEIVKLRLELEESKLEKSGYDSPNSIKDEAYLMSLVSIFLHVHPVGASIDYICSILIKIIPTINARDVESLLRRYPLVFSEVCTIIGASSEKKWTYIGFKYQN